MTALADISKGMLAVASLKGSDLEEFNEAHPRSADGRFARVATGPIKDDPRIAREARRRRRQRRGLAEIVGQRAAAAKEALDASALQSLRRERVLPERRTQVVTDPRVKAKKETKKETRQETKTKPLSLTDESYGTHEGTTDIGEQSVIVLPREKVDQFLRSGSLAVGAANKMWVTSLTADSVTEGENSLAAQKIRERVSFKSPYQHDLIALRINDVFRAISSGENQESFVLSPGHVLAPTHPHPKSGMNVSDFFAVHENPGGVTDDDDYAPPSGREVMVPIIDVTVVKAASLLEWDDDAHPRDPDTGRFMSLHAGPGGPPGPDDPRVARARRHRRRQRRGLAEIAHVVEERPEPSARSLEDVRARTRHAPARQPRAILLNEHMGLESRPGSARTPLREVGRPTHEIAVVEPKPKSMRSGRPSWSDPWATESGDVVVPGAASEGLPDIGTPSDKDIRRTRDAYDPIEYDRTGRPIIPSARDTPRELVNPKLLPAYDAQVKAELRAHRERLQVLRARKAARKTP